MKNSAILRVVCLLLPLLAAWPATGAETPAPAAQVEVVDWTDANLFFTQYKEALPFFKKGHFAEAAKPMDLAVSQLNSSPWLELALLKSSALKETVDDALALEGYATLNKRLTVAPYFQTAHPQAQLFRTALHAAAEMGVRRIKLQRIRNALSRYNLQFGQYPAALSALATYNFIDKADLLDSRNQGFRYSASQARLFPTVKYMQYQLERASAEPFIVDRPQLDSTTRISDQPERYAALIRLTPKAEPSQVTADQTIDGYFVGAITPRGIVLCRQNRVIVLPTGN